MKKKGFLITLEGNDGCGKSTQAEFLYYALKRMKKKVVLTREPGGTPIGNAIREVVLDNKHEGMSRDCETFLYMASRAQLVADVVKPMLEAGYIVVCDRWLDATVAYQGYGAGADVKRIERMGEWATQGIKPRATLFFDLPLKEGLRRATKGKKGDRMESKALAFHERVRKGFFKILRKDPRRFRRIPVSPVETPERVHQKVLKELRRVL